MSGQGIQTTYEEIRDGIRPELHDRIIELIIAELDAGRDVKDAVKRVAWDALAEARAKGWSQQGQTAIVGVVLNIGAEIMRQALDAVAVGPTR